jgi:hypothetical protein
MKRGPTSMQEHQIGRGPVAPWFALSECESQKKSAAKFRRWPTGVNWVAVSLPFTCAACGRAFLPAEEGGKCHVCDGLFCGMHILGRSWWSHREPICRECDSRRLQEEARTERPFES